jgi:hypothetical protein
MIQGARVEDERAVAHPFVAHFSKMKYRFSKTLPLKCSVLFSEMDIPPNYREDNGTSLKLFYPNLTGIVKRLAALDLDLKSLGTDAFTLYKGPKGEFYQVKFSFSGPL